MTCSEQTDCLRKQLHEERFAVIILNYYGASDTIRCVESVERHMDATCFVVDNTADHKEGIRLKEILDYTSCTHFYWPGKNLGFAAGVNLALKKALEAGFTRFFLLNNDAVIREGAGDMLGRVLSQNPGSIIAPVIRWADRICRESFYHPYWGRIIRHRPQSPQVWIRFFTGCALAFDRRLLEKVGFFDESFFFYGEDIVFCQKAQRIEAPVILLDDILVYHKGSHAAKMASFFYEYHMARMHWLLSFKLFEDPVRRIISLATKTATLVPRALIRCLRYRTVAPFLAMVASPFNFHVRPK